MKTLAKIVLLGLIIVSSITAKSQTIEQFIAEKQIHWVGIDFTHVKLIGSHGFTNPNHIVTGMFDYWNNMVLKEASKYDVKEFTHKESLSYFVDETMKNNRLVDETTLVTNENDHRITEAQLQEIISNYNTKDKTGAGLVIITERMNKFEESVFMHFVLFDMASKKVLKSYYEVGVVGGFGFGNYWMRGFYGGMLSFERKYAKTIRDVRKGSK